MSLIFKSKSEFNVVKYLGGGGFGRAELVHRKDDFSQYVLKEVNLTKLRENLEKGQSLRVSKIIEMTRNEHIQMQKFNHPNIVRVFDAFEEKQVGSQKENLVYYIVMEFCEGGDLDGIIRQITSPLSEEQIQLWSRQLVSAIKFLHDGGFVHRDIKPKNIFLTGDRKTVKLGDFGLVKQIENGDPQSQTGIGTFEYCPPEFFQDKPYTAKSDIWALGVTIFELANRTRPFGGSGPACMFAVLNKQPAPFSGDYTTELREFVDSMLQKDPATRPDIAQVVSSAFLCRNSLATDGPSLAIKTESLPVPKSPSTGALSESLRSLTTGTRTTTILLERSLSTDQLNAVRSVLEENYISEEMLLNFSEDDIKKLFPQVGLQVAVIKWQKHLMDQINKEMLSYSAKFHPMTKTGNLIGLEQLISEIRSKYTTLSANPLFLKPLVEHKDANDGERPALLQASARGHMKVVQYLVNELGADITAREGNDPKAMAIHVAAERGHREVLRFFLEKNPDLLEAKTANKDTALNLASLGGQLDVVQFLVDIKGANIDNRGQTGRTPLHLAVCGGHTPVVQYLLQKGADIKAKDESQLQSLPIHLAAATDNVETMKILLLAMPNLLEEKNVNKETALNRAVVEGKMEAVKFLIGSKNANIENRGNRGRTPLMQAASVGKLELVKYLIAKGANVYAKDTTKDEDMAVHLAAFFGEIEVVRYLITLRPDLKKLKNKTGSTALNYAQKKGHAEIVTLLSAK